MQGIGLLLLGMASLVASGVIMDRGRVGLNAVGGLGLQTVQGVRGGIGGGNVLTRDELLRQKFILDVLQQIYVPLQQQDLLMLEDRNIIANEDLYIRPLTQEMQEVLDLIRNNQLLGKQAICDIRNEQHVRQLVGLYRLFVNARDFDIFKRLVVYARQNVNNEMFVYSFILALGERRDTQMLIVPALHEILPQLFIQDRVIDQVRHLDTGVSSIRPQLLDVVGMGRRNLFENSRIADQQGGLFDIFNKSQLWMPWRELHRQMAVRKMTGGNVVQQDVSQLDKMVVSLPGNGLLSQDIGLKSYLGLFIDEILLNQDTIRNSIRNYAGYGGLEHDINEHRYGQRNEYDIMGDIQRNRVDNDYYVNSLYGKNLYGRQVNTANREEIDSERLLNVGRRFRNNVFGVTGERDEDIDVDRNLYMDRENLREEQSGINTVSVDDPRLLFVGRRRKNPNNVVNMGNSRYEMGNSRYQLGNNQYDEDDYISGGRRVASDVTDTNERQKSKYNRNVDDMTLENDRYVKTRGRGKMMNIDNEQEDLYLHRNRDINSKTGYHNYQDTDYINRNTFGRGLGHEDRKSDDFLNFITRGRVGQRQSFENDEDDYISGGRRVASDVTDTNERQKSKYNRYVDDMTLENDRYVKTRGRGKMMNIDNEQEDLYLHRNRDINSKTGYHNYQDTDYINRNTFGRGLGQEGRKSDDFLNFITRGRVGQRQSFENDEDSMYNRRYIGQRQSFDNDQDWMYNRRYFGQNYDQRQSFDNDQDSMYNRRYIGQNRGEGVDMYLPTTDVNDERLLHTNRRKLNNVDGFYVNNNAENGDYDYNNRYNTEYQGYQRGNINSQRANYDEQSYLDRMQRGNENIYTEERMNDDDDKHGKRYRRSVVNRELGQTSTINGKLVLYSLQQLVARLNIERIALGQPLLIENTHNTMERGIISSNLRGFSGNVDVHTIAEIENIIQRINHVLQQRIEQITIPSYNQKINEMGLILAGQIRELGLTNILGDVLHQTNQQERRGLVVNMLENEAAQILLAGIVKVVDQRLQQIYLQREEFISTVRGVTINNVGVDKLQTFLEETDVDLTNLLNNNRNVDQTTRGNNKVVVGRLHRLNHKSFNIDIDVTSDRQQQVVIRNLLVPKVDGHDNIIPLVERRQNVILLDVTTAELHEGRNSLKLNSRDITITSRDTTPYTRIYQLVMQALNGNAMLQQDLLVGQSTLLPHRLLLPRGRVNGLPMQLITIITPLTGSSGIMGIQRGAELNTLFLDNLPLNYPLHCDITNLDDVVSMPNLSVTDVKIYHEDNIRMPLMNMH